MTLVGHSRAGALLPAIAARLGPAVRKIVYVDARLPHPGRTWLSTLSPEQADRMRAKAKSLGKQNFFIFGEGFDGKDDLIGSYTWGGKDPATLKGRRLLSSLLFS